MVVPLAPLIILTILWFVVFWMLGGVMFAVIGLVRFLKVNKNRFSCLFTLFSGGAAFGAAWMGLQVVYANRPRGCGIKLLAKHQSMITDVLPNLFECYYREILSAAVLWFLFLLVMGIGLLFISRTPELPRDIHGNH